MKIKALIPFVGQVTMGAGDTRDVPDEVAKDLIDAGYATKVGEAKAEPTEKKPAPKKSAKK